jgi:hypothetical protein
MPVWSQLGKGKAALPYVYWPPALQQSDNKHFEAMVDVFFQSE